ncbi:MAG: hypothetical protein ACK559_30305 [bacterium]
MRQAGLPYVTDLEFLRTFSARTERPPFFRLHLLERSCRSELTGRARGAGRSY